MDSAAREGCRPGVQRENDLDLENTSPEVEPVVGLNTMRGVTGWLRSVAPTGAP